MISSLLTTSISRQFERVVIKSPFKLKGRTRSCVDDDGGFRFPFRNSQVSLFSTPEGETRLVIPLKRRVLHTADTLTL